MSTRRQGASTDAERRLLAALAVYFGIVLWRLIALFRRFRLPAGSAGTGTGDGGGEKLEPS